MQRESESPGQTFHETRLSISRSKNERFALRRRTCHERTGGLPDARVTPSPTTTGKPLIEHRFEPHDAEVA